MSVKITETPQREQSGAGDVGRLFSFMHVIAWMALVAGAVMSLWSVGDFSDTNLTLMMGIGLMVGSVFIYTIGTAIQLVHKREI